MIAVSSNNTYQPPGTTCADDSENDIRNVSPQALKRFAERPGAQVFAFWIQQPSPTDATPLQAHAISAEDYEKFMDKVEDMDDPELLQKLPQTYHDLAAAFSRRNAHALPRSVAGVDPTSHCGWSTHYTNCALSRPCLSIASGHGPLACSANFDVEATKIVRQQGGDQEAFRQVLEALRHGTVKKAHWETLMTRTKGAPCDP